MGIKFNSMFQMKTPNINWSFEKINSYIFLALIINNWATKDTIDPTKAAKMSKAKLSFVE